MREWLFRLGIVVAAILCGVVAASGTWLFWDTVKMSDQDAFRALLGAFAGAFFAFLFVRLAEGLKRIYDRKEKHHTTLVRLEHYFNDSLNITSDNIFIADTFLEKSFQPDQLIVFSNRFYNYPIDRELVLGLTNLDFANDLYTLNVELRKLNDSMATLDRSCAQVMRVFLSKNIDLDTYIASIRYSRHRYVEIREFLLEVKSDLVRMLAIARLLNCDAPFLVRVICTLAKSSYPRRFKSQLKEELVRVNAEVEENARVSQSRINAVQARMGHSDAPGDTR